MDILLLATPQTIPQVAQNPQPIQRIPQQIPHQDSIPHVPQQVPQNPQYNQGIMMQQNGQFSQMAQNYIAYQQMMNQQFQQYHQQMAQMQYQNGYQQNFQQKSNLPDYSMPPSIYNQPVAPPPPQQFQNFVAQT